MTELNQEAKGSISAALLRLARQNAAALKPLGDDGRETPQSRNARFQTTMAQPKRPPSQTNTE
ncbi:MAG: hypothetical protein AAFP91_17185 [Pseudomonadota bacterium]